MNDPILADHFDREALASELHVTKRTLERWAVMRKGPSFKKVGRSVYYSRKAVQQWLEQSGGAQ